MQNKGKAVKTAIIIVLVLVVLAGAVGVTTVLFKRNNVEDNEPLRIVIDNFELGHANSGGYNVFCKPDTYSRLVKELEKNGYINIEVEIKGIEEEFTWSVYFDGSVPELLKKDVTFTVDEQDVHKGVLTIKSLEKDLISGLALMVHGKDSYSSIYFGLLSFEDIFGDNCWFI